MSRNAAWVIFALLFAPPALAKTTHKLLVSVGANVGDPDDEVLSFADDDAERVRQVFVELGGVRPDRASLIVNQDAAAVRQKLSEVAGRISELTAGGDDAILFVYVSAHARAGTLHLGGTHLPLADLRDAARAAGARLTVLLVDACESGTLARRKGVRARAEFDVSMEQLPLHGEVVISSSGPGESSEEWDSLRGSLFTHHLLTGLRGDADAEGDGKVSLAEVYGYAYRRTVAGAAGPGQHPAFAWQLSGTGELVLTEPVAARSAIVFPASAEGRYVVSSQPRPDVVAEVDKLAGRPLRLAVPPGRYLVRKRAGASTGLLEVELPYGGERPVQDAELAWRRYTEVSLKGGYVSLRTRAVLLLGRLESGPVAETGGRLGAGLGFQQSFGALWARATVGFSRADYRGVELEIDERRLVAGLSGGYRFLEWPVVPYLGVTVELSGLEQRLVRDREEEIQETFGVGPLPPRRTGGFAAGLTAGVEIPIEGPLFALLHGQLLMALLPAAGAQPAWTPAGQGWAALGWRF